MLRLGHFAARSAQRFVRPLSLEASRPVVEKAVTQSPVMVFSKTWCPYCSRAKQLIAENGGEATVVELDTEANGSALQQVLRDLTGQSTVPHVFIGGKFIGGCSDTEALLRKGELQGLLQDAMAASRGGTQSQ